MLFASFVERKKAYATSRYRDDVLVSSFCTPLFFVKLRGGKNGIQLRNILKISWRYLGFYLQFFVVLFGSFVVEKSAFNPDIFTRFLIYLVVFCGSFVVAKRRIQPRDILKIS